MELQTYAIGLLSLFTTNVTWAVFGAVLIFFILYSLMLLYHWLRYGISSVMVWVAMAVYFAVSFVLLSTMLASATQLLSSAVPAP